METNDIRKKIEGLKTMKYPSHDFGVLWVRKELVLALIPKDQVCVPKKVLETKNKRIWRLEGYHKQDQMTLKEKLANQEETIAELLEENKVLSVKDRR